MDPAWVQALAAILQTLLAGAIWIATWRYVRLTNRLVGLQVDIVALQEQAARRELYSRRFDVFLHLMNFLGRIAIDAKVELPQIQKLYYETNEAEFIFHPEVSAFIRQVGANATRYHVLGLTAQGTVELVEIETWLVETARDEARLMFGKYLEIANLRERPTQ